MKWRRFAFTLRWTWAYGRDYARICVEFLLGPGVCLPVSGRARSRARVVPGSKSDPIDRKPRSRVSVRRRLLGAASSTPRARLVKLMQSPSGLTVLDAPRGFGKTALAGLWLSAPAPLPNRPVVWVPAPDAPTNHIDYWDKALTVIQDSCEAVPRLADNHAYPERKMREYLAASTVPFVVVFNRVDLIEGHGLGERLTALIDDVPGLKIIVTLQDRASVEVLDNVRIEESLTVDDLRYTPDEAVALFSGAGIAVPADVVHSICGRLAGVPALMKVAVDVVSGLPERSRSREIIMQRIDLALYGYTKRQVPPKAARTELSNFTLRIAAARTVTVATAQLLVPGVDVAPLMNRLESSALLFRDRHRENWYFPPAVREALMRIDDETGGASRERLLLLSRYCLDHGDIADAVHYAIDAQDWSEVAAILSRHWADLLVAHSGLLRKAMWSMPEEIMSASRSMQVGRDMLEFRLRTPSVDLDTYNTESSELADVAAMTDVLAQLNSGTVQVIVLRASGEHGRSADVARTLVDIADYLDVGRIDEFRSQLPALRLIWGVAFQLVGNVDDAATQLAIAYQDALHSGPRFVARHSAGNAALNEVLRGRLSEASQWLLAEGVEPDVPGWLGPPSHIGGAIARLLIALDTLDLSAAAAAIEILDGISPAGDVWAFEAYARTRWALARRDPFAGLVTLQRAGAANEPPVNCGVSSGAAMLSAARIDLLLAAGEGAKAIGEAAVLGDHLPIVQVSAARAYFLTGNPERALQLCRAIDWSADFYPRVHTEAKLVETAAYHSLGEWSDAGDSWSRACELVERTGALSAFSTIPRRVIEDLETRAPSRSSSVVAFLESEAVEMYPPTIERLVLSRREAEVLRGLSDGLPIADIARKLFVTQNTMKSHIRRLYRKLGVHSRDEAVAAAHRLSLLGAEPVRQRFSP